MSVLTREKIIFAKRTAMSTAFWCACALDDDNGFDRLMHMQSKSELENDEWGGVFTHSHLEYFQLTQIQRIVRKNAVELLCILVGVTEDVAITALQRARTSEIQNADGEYTQCNIKPPRLIDGRQH